MHCTFVYLHLRFTFPYNCDIYTIYITLCTKMLHIQTTYALTFWYFYFWYFTHFFLLCSLFVFLLLLHSNLLLHVLHEHVTNLNVTVDISAREIWSST